MSNASTPRPPATDRRPTDADQAALDQALAGLPIRRDLLIEHLHRLQDLFGGLRPGPLAALARRHNLPQAEIYETASFYAHFEILDENAPDSKPLARVCDGPICTMRGADDLIGRLEKSHRVRRVPCVGRCADAPAWLAVPEPPTPIAALPPAFAIDDPERVLDELEQSGLRGMGGAGFPTARKWRLVREQPKPRILVVNADEGEPGTFKDRHLLIHHLPRVVAGIAIAARVIEAEAVYIYLRDEYADLIGALNAAFAALPAGMPPIHLRRGAGAYVCGEETALLESLEGKRGLPRQRPPYAAEAGLFGRPTLINNVETLAWVPTILAMGGREFAARGRHGAAGLRLYSLSGRIRNPGVKEAPNGVTTRELIEEFGGGMEEGHDLTAFLPGGASGGLLPARLADVPLTFGTLEPHGAFTGSGAVMVFSKADDLRQLALGLMGFFAHESCGQCTPCRMGCGRALDLMATPRWNRPALESLAAVMRDASICGLGQAAPNVFLSLLRHVPELVA